MIFNFFYCSSINNAWKKGDPAKIFWKYFENISKQMIQLELQDNKLDWEMKKLLIILEKI